MSERREFLKNSGALALGAAAPVAAAVGIGAAALGTLMVEVNVRGQSPDDEELGRRIGQNAGELGQQHLMKNASGVST